MARTHLQRLRVFPTMYESKAKKAQLTIETKFKVMTAMTIDRTTTTLARMNENIPHQAAKQSRPFVTQETKITAPSGYYRPARVVLKLKGLKYELITLFGKSHTSFMSKL